LGLWSLQIRASLTVVLGAAFFCQASAFFNGHLLAAADSQTWAALGVGGRLHQTMLGWRFAWHIKGRL
jgi:hypothetical protein